MKTNVTDAAIVISCLAFGITPEQLMSTKKDTALVSARACVSRLLRNEAGLKLEDIGKALKLDHSTVVHHTNKMVLRPYCNSVVQRSAAKFKRVLVNL